jgi:hypothetical protein
MAARAAYVYRKCPFCSRSLAVAGLAQYNHLAGHWRRTFGHGGGIPSRVYEIERVLRATSRKIA